MSYHHAVAVGLRSIPFSFLCICCLCAIGGKHMGGFTWSPEHEQTNKPPWGPCQLITSVSTTAFKIHSKKNIKKLRFEITNWQSSQKSPAQSPKSPLQLLTSRNRHWVCLRGSPLGLLAHPQVWRAHAWISWEKCLIRTAPTSFFFGAGNLGWLIHKWQS